MMTNIIIELIHPSAKLPTFAHEGDACADLYSVEHRSIRPGESYLFKMGFKMEMGQGWEAQIRPRSSMGIRGLLTHPGTIDHRYRKEVGVILTNPTWCMPYTVKIGDRVAQMKLERVHEVDFIEGKVNPTARGGFGSSGT